MSAMSTSLPLNENDEVRAMTRSSGTCARRFSSSSEMPSAKYSWSLSGLMFTNGSTAIERVGRELRQRSLAAASRRVEVSLARW